MARTRNAIKRQRVESALFNPDVVFLLVALLDARDLTQMTLTCKAMGGKQAAHNGLSLVEEASRRLFECSTDEWERSCLPKYDDEGWIELYHHLLMLRSKLTFDQLVGDNIQYGEEKSTALTNAAGHSRVTSTAMCTNHVMRSGRHFTFFTALVEGMISSGMIGITRPIQIDVSDVDYNRSAFLEGVILFNPAIFEFWGYLMSKRTERWGDSDVHCCCMNTYHGQFKWCDWACRRPSSRIIGFRRSLPVGLLLDLDEGTLSMYQNGQRLTTLKDGLSGEYCWYGTVYGDNVSISIHRA